VYLIIEGEDGVHCKSQKLTQTSK